MSNEYDEYLRAHRDNVKKGLDWLQLNLPEVLEKEHGYEWEIEFHHDSSKNETDEYDAYDAYFYGNNRSYEVVQEYQKAWLIHLHRNPHHWQYWILINDDPNEGMMILEMPFIYVIEMICDWWSFSWKSGNLSEIFDWYDKYKDHIKLHPNTRKQVENILEKMKNRLET